MKQRTTTPKNNKYYITRGSGGLNGAIEGKPTQKGANVLDNCVGFCNGRFAESQNDPDLKEIYKAFKYQLVCDAEDFIESAKRQGLKISKTPVEGGIMVWQKGSTLSPHDGAGHVAFVEAVYDDGTILTSESGWLSWAFKLVRRDNKNGRWGQNSAYKFRGCIINPSITNPKVVPVPPLTVDGIGGPDTIRALQHFVGTPEDGEISGQLKKLAKYHPALKAVTYGSGGSVCIKAVQKWLGITADGQWGKDTSEALQYVLGVDADGIFGPASMKALQKYLNTHDKADPSAGVPTLNKGKVIDVSEFQEKIDWNKVKESGIVGAIIRCGYRGAEKGTLNTDAHFFEHIKGAHAAGLKVGIYIFTEGINAAEGAAEADYAVQLAQKAGIPLSYPIAVDTEAINSKKYTPRANGLSKAKRTEVIKAFCERIKALGFEPMIYASTSWLNNKLDMAQLPYKVWVAQYNTVCEYKGEYVLWQYTSQGSVPGINGNVDMNECYLEDTEPVDPKPSVKIPSLHLIKTNAQVIADTITWACWIAGDNDFHYGHGKAAHHNGCYFCGTEPESKKNAGIVDWERTYCCNPFIGAAWAHGGCVPKALELCQKGTSWDFNSGRGYDASKLFDNLGKPAKSKLRAGDVLCSDNHVALYIGNGKIAEASGGDDNIRGSKKWNISIHTATLTDARYEKFKRVHRFNGSVDKDLYIRHGEISDRVADLQSALSFFGYDLKTDRIFGSDTFKALKDFQKDHGLVSDGIAGPATIKAFEDEVNLAERGTA